MEFSNEELNNFGNDLLRLLENYKEKLPLCEVVYILITNAVSASLKSAPNEMVGIKTVLASIYDVIFDLPDSMKGKEDMMIEKLTDFIEEKLIAEYENFIGDTSSGE